MQRTKHRADRQPTAILAGDQHLREDQPICRTDNFWSAQWKKMEFKKNLANEYNCPIISTGDLFNHWKPSPHLLTGMTAFLMDLNSSFYLVYGNHDLPQWNVGLMYKTGINTLATANLVKVLSGWHWGQTPNKKQMTPFRNVLVWHVMTFPQGRPPWPGCEDMPAEEILDKYPQFDLIVTGHNHSTFVVERDGRLLVNPGSLTRQTADQVDHHPCVFLWYAEDNTVEKIVIPHQEGVISREHIDKVKERDERVEHFISQLSAQYKVGLNFEENLERFRTKNNIRQPVMDIIRRAVE